MSPSPSKQCVTPITSMPLLQPWVYLDTMSHYFGLQGSKLGKTVDDPPPAICIAPSNTLKTTWKPPNQYLLDSSVTCDQSI